LALRRFHATLAFVPVNLEELLHQLDVELGRLKVLYEQYFIGIEKNPPTVARREVEKLLALLGAQTIGNTAVKFRYTALLHRWRVYSERWEKILREIENGTYSRHREKLKRRAMHDGDGARAPSRSADGNGAPHGVPGMSDAELHDLYRSYVEACRALGDTRDVKFESLVRSLERQVPALLERNNCRELAFSVAIRDGKVVLRALPKRASASESDDESQRPPT